MSAMRWLMDHVGVSEPITGDILEEGATRRFESSRFAEYAIVNGVGLTMFTVSISVDALSARARQAIPGWIVIGWFVARLNGATLVLPYVVVSCLIVAPDLWRQASNAIEDARVRPYFYIAVTRETLFAMGVLAGAPWSERRYVVNQS